MISLAVSPGEAPPSPFLSIGETCSATLAQQAMPLSMLRPAELDACVPPRRLVGGAPMWPGGHGGASLAELAMPAARAPMKMRATYFRSSIVRIQMAGLVPATAGTPSTGILQSVTKGCGVGTLATCTCLSTKERPWHLLKSELKPVT